MHIAKPLPGVIKWKPPLDNIKVVNIVPVLAIPTGMYRIGLYTYIEILMFRTGLNIDHVPANFGQF